MNIKDYISSGILEAYVLGELSGAESKEVEQKAAAHPEIKEELQIIEQSLLALAMETSITPNEDVKKKLMDSVSFSKDDDTVSFNTHEASAAEPKELKVNGGSIPSGFKWLMAAAVSIAVISSIVAVSFWNRYNNTKEQLEDVIAQNERLAETVQEASLQLADLSQDFKTLNDSSMIPVPMKGLETAPNALAFVHWNHSSQEVYLNVNNLPIHDEDEQYQLWAIVDGKPVDAGVFDLTTAVDGLVKMKNIGNASAFAVTLEPKGGSINPTMENMVVMGNVKT